MFFYRFVNQITIYIFFLKKSLYALSFRNEIENSDYQNIIDQGLDVNSTFEASENEKHLKYELYSLVVELPQYPHPVQFFFFDYFFNFSY